MSEILALIAAPGADQIRDISRLPQWGAIADIRIDGDPDSEALFREAAFETSASYLRRSGMPVCRVSEPESRMAACRHEAAHVIVAASSGCKVQQARVWKASEGWTGFTSAQEPPTSSDESMIPRIGRLLAGVLGELTAPDSFIPGSSADEIGAAHALCVAVGLTTGIDPDWLAEQLVTSVYDHLVGHVIQLEEVATHLFDWGIVTRAELLPVFRRCRRLNLLKIGQRAGRASA